MKYFIANAINFVQPNLSLVSGRVLKTSLYLVGLLEVLLERPAEELGLPAAARRVADPAPARRVGAAREGEDAGAVAGLPVQVGVARLVAQRRADVLVLGRQSRDPVRVQHVLTEFLKANVMDTSDWLCQQLLSSLEFKTIKEQGSIS